MSWLIYHIKSENIKMVTIGYSCTWEIFIDRLFMDMNIFMDMISLRKVSPIHRHENCYKPLHR